MDLQERSGGVASKWDQLPLGDLPRKEKRKTIKKLKRKALRKEAAERERAEEEACLNDPAEQLRIQLHDQAEAEALRKARNDFEHHERIWLQNYHEAQKKRQEELHRKLAREAAEKEEQENWEYVEDGPAEIIWQGNEIIVQKKRIRVPKGKLDANVVKEDSNRPISNPLVPQRDAFEAYKKPDTSATGLGVFDVVEQQMPNFGTEQDTAHCPFHIKTGACRFGARCSRAHFYPDKSCTLLMKNMYNGPGLTWEQEEGLEYTDEEVTQHYEEFYDDVHTEFLKFGELVNFKVCKNGSSHLRGNVYVHYMSLDSAIDAYNAINGRFFAAKQVICEFVTVTKWRGAICAEYIKSHHKNCSHGSACNFLHCFENPGGEYEWADWDGRPPRSWQRKMDMLFGGSKVDRHWKQRDQDHRHHNGHSDRGIRSRSGCRSSSRQHKSHERDFCSSDDNGGTPIREYSGGSKYNSEEEREQWPDIDQPCDTYNRRVNQRSCSHNRGGIEKSKKGDDVISEEHRKYMDRHQLRRKKHGEHSYGHDKDDEERSAIGVEMHLPGEMQFKRTPIREYSRGRKYSSEEEREQWSDLEQPCDTYNRQVGRVGQSNLGGGIEKFKKGDEVILEEDRKNTDWHQIRRNKRHKQHTCGHDNDDEERSAVGVDMHLAGEMQFKRKSCIRFEFDDDMDKFKSNDREIMEKEDFKNSYQKKERKRRAQYRLESKNIDQEERKSLRSHHYHGQSPCKHKDYRKTLRRNRYSKSPRRSKNHYRSQSEDKVPGMSPDRVEYNNSLENKSRDSCS